MQLLTGARTAARSGRRARGGARECAIGILEGLPPVMWFIRCEMRRHRTCGLSVPQFRALALIDRYPTAALSLVAEHLGSSQPSASRLVTGLVARGFVTRKESPEDRRQVKLLLTARGRSVLDAARAATQESLARELGALGAKQRDTIVTAMNLLHDIFACTAARKSVNGNGNGNDADANDSEE